MRISTSGAIVVAALVVVGGVGYWQGRVHAPRAPGASTPAASAASAVPGRRARFTPPPDSAIPNDEFGREARRGQQIFDQTGLYAKKYTGNVLNCANCHIDAGRLANSAPLWGAYVSYPAYRSKNKHVNTFQERMQGCFRYSMNGVAPPLGDSVLVALESYAYWLATGAPVNEAIAGRGYPKVPKPALAPDDGRGAAVYAQRCALCHGADGQGQRAAGAQVFPPLWGSESFNWGAGMADVNNAAGFIKANMPFGLGGTLSDQEAWDLATFVDGHERPQDPRFTGAVDKTRALYHDSPMSRYGTVVNGVRLGEHSVLPGGSTRGAATNSAKSR
jgi:thiosulfate dehydrogenase